jgi:hypothetical protein
MQNHSLYKELKQIAFDGDYTVDQIQFLEFSQAIELLGTGDFTLTFLNNMKRSIIGALRDRDDEFSLQQLKQQIQNVLDTNFVGWEVERGRQGGKPYVKIWLEGKP